MKQTTIERIGPRPSLSGQSLEDLSTEILLLIFEELYNSEGSDGFKPVRLVSRTLSAAVAPFFFRDVNFKPSKDHSPAFLPHLELSLENLYTYARKARVHLRMNWELVAAVLFKCRRIERLDWAFWGDAESKIPQPIQDFLHRKSPRVRLYVWRYNILAPTSQNSNPITVSQIGSIPNLNLAGLSLSWPVSKSENSNAALAELLTSSPHLESLNLCHVRKKLPINKRLPPIRHLSLSRWCWDYTAEEVSQIWDLSRLEALTTRGVEILESVSGQTLTSLRRLSISTIKRNNMEETAEFIGRYLLKTPQLLEINLTCKLSSFPITSLMRHSSLHTLSLKNSLWASGRREGVRTIAASGLDLLQVACKHIARLSLDVQDCDIFPTLDAISKFRNLRRLTVRLSIRLLERGDNDSNVDVDYHSANQIASYLSSRKEGVQMEKLSIDISCSNFGLLPWSRAWEAQRAKGHIPERFFIFTWDQAREMHFEEIKGQREEQLSIADLGLAKWLQVHRFPPK